MSIVYKDETVVINENKQLAKVPVVVDKSGAVAKQKESTMGCCTKRCCGIYTVVIFNLLAVIGLVLALMWSTIYNSVVEKELVLANDSQSYKLWKETPIPMYMSVYMFNWTNYDEVVKSKWTKKPHFEECGPYVYLEHHVRVNLTWNNENDTVTYQQVRYWHFMPNMSNGNLNDMITNLNPIIATIGTKLRNNSKFNYLYSLLSPILDLLERKLIVTKTVDELLFTGFEDKILDILHKVPELNIIKRFGWFYMRNGSSTADGTFNMYTGKNNVDELGVIKLWNGKPKTSAFNGACADVTGTSGELWPPVENLDRVFIFSSDICSSFALDYVESNLTLNGVDGKKFIGTDFNFDNGTKYPDQACFAGGKKIASGLRSVSRCRAGAPAFISYPHFYLADQSYTKAIDGVKANKTLHEMYILLEPKTGIPLEANAQMQLNLLLQNVPKIKLFENVKDIFIPMIWFKQSATLTKKYTQMADVLIWLSHFGVIFTWSLFGVSLLLSFIGYYLIFTSQRKEVETQHLLQEEQET